MELALIGLGILAGLGLTLLPRTSLRARLVEARSEYFAVEVSGYAMLVGVALTYLGAVSLVRLSAEPIITHMLLGPEVIVGALGVLLATGLSAWAYLSPPEWAEDLSKAWWAGAAVTAAIVGSAVAVAAAARTGAGDEIRLLTVGLGASALSVVFVFSLVTDMKLRLVDRRLINIATAFTAVFGGAHLTSPVDPVTLTAAVMLLLFGAFLLLFATSSVGASDARALCLVATAAIPIIGWNGFLWASFGAGLYFILIGLTVAFIKRTMKSSMPAVPMLLFPYWATAVVSLFYVLPAWNLTLPI